MSFETKRRAVRRSASLGLTAGIALGLAGCAHNDVLVFGTSTTIGASVQTTGGQGAPSILIGFERQEAVWMPLLANGLQSQIANCRAVEGRTCPQPTNTSPPAPPVLYQSIVRENGTVVRTDSYSVFASLGASFNARARANDAEAGSGLAQFFATGNAAISVTQNESLVTALKVSSPASSAAQERAVAAAATNATLESTVNAIPADRRAALTALGLTESNVHRNNVSRVMLCAFPDSGTPKWSDLVGALDGSVYSLTAQASLRTSATRSQVEDRLIGNEDLTNDVLAKARLAPFNCS